MPKDRKYVEGATIEYLIFKYCGCDPKRSKIEFSGHRNPDSEKDFIIDRAVVDCTPEIPE